MSDYVGLSPYHLDQSFKMIVGQSPEQYAHARKMTAAAKEMVQSSSRLVDVAKSITIIVQMILRMILVIFMDFTNSSIYEKRWIKITRTFIYKVDNYWTSTLSI